MKSVNFIMLLINSIKYNLTRFFLLCFVFIISHNISAQNKLTKPNLWENFTTDMGDVFEGIGYIYTMPLKWKGNQFMNVGVISLSTLVIYTIDEDISRNFIKNKENVPDFLLKYGWYAGSPQINYGFIGSVYLSGLLSGNSKLRRTGILLLSSATATGFLQQLTKSSTGRARPSAELGKNHFRPFGGSSGYRSFPSGHAVLTFTTAHAIAKQFNSWWIKGPIYTLGIIPGLSRIYEGAHWMSDVVLSWSISYFVVEAIDKYLNSKHDLNNNNLKNKTSINLAFSKNTIGMLIKF